MTGGRLQTWTECQYRLRLFVVIKLVFRGMLCNRGGDMQAGSATCPLVRREQVGTQIKPGLLKLKAEFPLKSP